MAKWAVVTGASSGIGAAFAAQFAANKINVVLAARDKAELQKVASELEKLGIETLIFAGDLSLPVTAKELYEFVIKHKLRVDYLINNAGFGDYGQFMTTDIAKEQSMINLNIGTLTYLSKVFGRDMQAAGQGYIVNVASTAAFFPGPLMAVYYASKAYVLRFSVAINEELKDSGVSVTALCPGPTSTKFAAAASATQTSIFKGKLPTAEAVAAFGYQAMLQRKPVAVHGLQNRLVSSVSGLLPPALAARAVGRIQAIKS